MENRKGKRTLQPILHPGTQIKSLSGEGTEIIVAAFLVTAADAGYPLPVVAAGEKVLFNCLDPFEAKLPEGIGILLIIPIAEIGEMTREDLMKGVSAFSVRKYFVYPHRVLLRKGARGFKDVKD
jgi:hypothetical protein